jgi:nitronate monooxygenase
MGSAAGGKLAAAVTNAGGLGLVGSGYANADAVRKELVEAGNARVGIGFILWALEKNPSALDVALEARPAAVMLSFGDPTPFTGRIKDAGCKIICQVQTLAQAREAADAGADIIIAQGRDAGGHSGMTRGTMGLVPAVVDAVAPIPVVAAGGIADGRGLAAALALGAAGVSMGTRFTASRESLWDQAMKAATLAAGGDQTEQTRVFDVVRGAAWPEIYPGRALRNDFSARWNGREDALAADRHQQQEAYLAATANDFATRVVWAGEGVDLVHDIPAAAEIIERIIAQAAVTLAQGAQLVREAK